MLTYSLHRDLQIWSSCWAFLGVQWGGNAWDWERRSHTFLHRCTDYNKTWLRSHRCASNTHIRTASQKSAV